MPEPVLRRSGRNAAKKDVPEPPTPAPVAKKRASAEPKKPVAKKIKTAADDTAIAKASANRPTEAASSSKTTAISEKPEKAEKLEKPAAKSAAKSVAKPAPANPAKAKKADEASEGLKDGDLVPTDLPEVQTEDGSKITIENLLKSAQKGIIIFAYPRASTPGCTTQACLFKDSFLAFSDAGYTVYGLSGDSPAANEKFKSKHNLTYTLLCDPTYELHEKLSIRKKPKGTIRSVVIIEKVVGDGHAGKVLRISPASPQISLQIAKEAVGIDHASMIAAAAQAKEAEKKTLGNETNLPLSTVSVDAVA